MHGVIEIGPFGLGSGDLYQTVADGVPFVTGPRGRVTIQVAIDSGTDDAAPTDNPSGAFRLYVSSGAGTSSRWVRMGAAEGGDNSMADLAPRGNAVVDGVANFEGVPMARARVVYERVSGGGADSRARLWIRVE
jgi:hypothetical protein